MPFETCPIIQVKDILQKHYGSISVNKDFIYREKFNWHLIRVKSSAVLKRLEQRNLKTFKRSYGTKREYKVHSEGVQFAHVRYIVYGYSLGLLIAFLIAICENIHNNVKKCLKNLTVQSS